jgi:hypothetical protein
MSGCSEDSGQLAREAQDHLADGTYLRDTDTFNEENVRDSVANHLTNHIGYTDLEAFGATAISLVEPTNPSVDTASTIAELIADRTLFGLPGMQGGLSGEWLNYNLAIAPLVSYAGDLKKTIQHADEILAQYERDAGRLVRRRFTPDPDIHNCVSTGSMWREHFSNFTAANVLGDWTVNHRRETRHWFSGSFTYALPPEGWRRKFSELDRLYGIRPGVDTAWEVVPLSFVADYFSNMGNVLHNLDAFTHDGLVMPYGYAMEEISHTWEVGGFRGHYPFQNNDLYFEPISYKLELTWKRRVPATPFGFGFDLGSLTTRQLSILGALGIQFLK